MPVGHFKPHIKEQVLIRRKKAGGVTGAAMLPLVWICGEAALEGGK
jgi:hypothetical protein